MKTSLMWDYTVEQQAKLELPDLPEGIGDFDSVRLMKGDKVFLTAYDIFDDLEVVVTKVVIDFTYTPDNKFPFGTDCECVQWVHIKEAE